MMNLNEFRRHFRIMAMGCIPALAIASAPGFPTIAQAQSPQVWALTIPWLQARIQDAEARHAGAAEMGKLWLLLGNRYQDQLQMTEAEDAFARSLKLLRAAGAQADIADALDGMGSLELATGRHSEARDCNQKALAIYEALGDRLHAGKMHETIALAWLYDRRYREAERESAAGLAELQQVANPNAGEMVAAYLTHSNALCSQKKCGDALTDVGRALALAQSNFPPESLEVVSALLTRGVAQWKTGSPEEGERTMGEALRLSRHLRNLPGPVIVGAQLGVMRQYDAFLKATHRAPEAAQVEAEIGQLQTKQQPAECNRCTVSAAALGFMP